GRARAMPSSTASATTTPATYTASRGRPAKAEVMPASPRVMERPYVGLAYLVQYVCHMRGIWGVRNVAIRAHRDRSIRPDAALSAGGASHPRRDPGREARATRPDPLRVRTRRRRRRAGDRPPGRRPAPA